MSRKGTIIILLAALQSNIVKQVDKRLSIHGISFSEFLVLYHLNTAYKKMLRRVDLAESVGLSASGVTRLVNPMEKTGLVQKELNARDARVSLVKITPAGQKIFKNAMVDFDQSAELLLHRLAPVQLGQLSEIARTLL